MKLVVVLSTVLALVQSHVVRRYYADEETGDGKRFTVFASEDGGWSLIDLRQRAINVEVNVSDVTMFLYTQRNKDEGVEVKLDELTIDTNYFDPSKICFFVSHGYTENYLGSNNVPIRDAILSKHDVNVFLLDWSKFSSLFYTTSVVAVPKIGAVFGNAIENLMEKYGMSYEQIHLCGHSLGAHVVGAIGAKMGGNADRIIATDPALPLFWLNDTEKRLDISDAKFVQVIHTNGGLQGFRSSIGHADYFPNGGGMNQPGCGSDLLGNCAHARAHKYYSESILTSRFVAKRCPSYEDFQLNRGCDSESLLGEFFTDKKANGDYYLDTAESKPFALG